MRVKDGPGAQYLDKTLGTNSKKLTASPAPGTYQLDVYVYDYAAGATVATRSTTVTVSSKPAAAAAPAAPAPASIAAPSLSATTWYADDPSTWPTVSTPSSLNSNQSIRVKDGPGNQYYNKALGASSGRLTASPAPGTYQLDVYVFDYSIGAVAATRNVTVEVLGPQANSGKGFWANAAGVFSGLRRVLGSLGVE